MQLLLMQRIRPAVVDTKHASVVRTRHRSSSWRNRQMCDLNTANLAVPESRGTMCRSTEQDVADKVFLVTGSTDGIGKHTARKLVQDGATVLIHGRNAMRVADTAAELAAAGSGSVAAFTQDLSSLQGVRSLAADVKRDFPRIDVLINNAAVFETEKRVSADGYEYTWAVNVLAPFLLTSCLLDVVASRIVNVSSLSASRGIDWDNLQQERGYSAHHAYSLSKLAMQMYTLQLAERLRARGITVNTLDPGTVNTKMLLAGWGRCGIEIEDANDLYWLSTSSDTAGVTGKYYVSRSERQMCQAAQDAAARQRLWDIMEVQTDARYPVKLG